MVMIGKMMMPMKMKMIGKTKIMEKIKQFFKPVEGGPQDGLQFGKWFIHMQRAGLISIFLLVVLNLNRLSPKEEWDPQWSFWGVEGFLSLILCLIVYKTLQHWGDLKNHTSR